MLLLFGSVCYNAGSPFVCNAIDPRSIHVNWDAVHLRRVGEPVEVLLKTDNNLMADGDIHCAVSGRLEFA